MIGKNIYSQKYKYKMLCGHYYYLTKLYYENDNNKKDNIYNKLIRKFGDNGVLKDNINRCKNCGEMLDIIDFDDTEGFKSTGQIKKSRDIWDKNNILVMKKDIKDRLEEQDICNSIQFKDALVKSGYSIILLEKIKVICNNIKDISSKIGIDLVFDDVVKIITDSLKYINYNITLSKFIDLEKKNLLKIGKSQKFIDKISDEKFKLMYKIKIENNKLIVLGSRILISILIANPKYVRKGVNNKCIFNGFEGEEGINYMVCILELLLKLNIYNLSYQNIY